MGHFFMYLVDRLFGNLIFAYSIIKSTDYAVIAIDKKKRIRVFNKTASRILGINLENSIGKVLKGDYVGCKQDDCDCFASLLLKTLSRSEDKEIPEEQEVTYRHPEHKREAILLLNVFPLKYKNKSLGAAAVIRDITEQKNLQNKLQGITQRLKEANKQLEKKATTCDITGLFNHRYFMNFSKKYMEQANRYNSSFAVAMLDIDDFKNVNDTYGHPVGDKVLSTLGMILSKKVRNCDIIARYGGEEFSLLMPETGKEGALTVCERIRKAVEENIFEDNIRLTISIGLSIFKPGDQKTIFEIISEADKALYAAKRKGKNQVVVFMNERESEKKL